MKITTAFLAVLLAGASQTRADILAGPFTNPTNGNAYYVLTPAAWSNAETEAENLGGTLAIIKSAEEQQWVYSTFSTYGGAQRSLWIGLHRKQPGGAFFWADGSPLDYADWYPGEPNNAGGNENCVELRWDTSAAGAWNDVDDATLLSGVVEVSSKVNAEQAKRSRGLVGEWYEAGRADRPCHIADAGNAVFAINESNLACCLVMGRNLQLYLTPWRIHGEILGEVILWSNGTWWSRKPMPEQDFDIHPLK